MEGAFTLVDDAEAGIEVPHSLDEAEPFALIDLRDADFVADVRADFEPRWAAATPLPE